MDVVTKIHMGCRPAAVAENHQTVQRDMLEFAVSASRRCRSTEGGAAGRIGSIAVGEVADMRDATARRGGVAAGLHPPSSRANNAAACVPAKPRSRTLLM